MYSSFYGHEAIARSSSITPRSTARTRSADAADGGVFEGPDAIVRLLLRAGARTDLRDTEHQLTALEFAEHKGNSRCVDLLKSHRVRGRGPLDRMHVLDPDPPKGGMPARPRADTDKPRRWAAMPASQRVGGGATFRSACRRRPPPAPARRPSPPAAGWCASVAEVQTWRAADGS